MSNNLQIFIDGEELKHFTGFSLSQSLDVVGDMFGATFPFYPDEKKYRDLFRPFEYQRVVIHINGKKIFTGRLEQTVPALTPRDATVVASGRSLPGKIVDVTFEHGDTLQFTQAKLDEIVAQVLARYDFKAVFANDPGAIFEEAGPSSLAETLFRFIQNLAKQRRLLMGQDAEGNLLFRRAITSGPVVAELVEGQEGLTLSTATYDGTARYSSFDVFGQEPGVNDNYARVVDPALDGIHRPLSVQANNNNAGSIIESANWIASAGIARSVTIPVELAGWTRPDGELWSENTLLTLQAKSIMLYRSSTYLITRVLFKRNGATDTTKLDLAIPGAYSGTMPEGYPWADV